MTDARQIAAASTLTLDGLDAFRPDDGAAARARKRRYAMARGLAEADIPIGECLSPPRRAAALADLPLFLRTYFRAEFSRTIDQNMSEVCRIARRTIESGGHFVCSCPRGSGKTVTLTRAALWAVLSGRRRFVVILGASGPAAARILDILKNDLCSNPLLCDDFPEVCEPYRQSGGQSIRLSGLRCNGEPLHAGLKRDRLVLPTLQRPGSAACGQILMAQGLGAGMRGITHPGANGKSIRPDLVLVDDPQTDKSAASESQTTAREELLSGAVLGLAGPNTHIAVLVAVTVIKHDDLAERLLTKHPEFEARRFRLVEKWPDSPLWDEYAKLWRDKRTDEATALYAANRSEMDRGAVVPCAWRVRPGELTALQTAFNLRLAMGEKSFACEMQGEPIQSSAGLYDLSADKIMTKTAPFRRFEVPPAAAYLVACIDINRSGLHWAAVAFANDFTGHVVAYGNLPSRGELWPENATERVKNQCIARGLGELVSLLATAPVSRAGTPMRLSALLVDAGFATETVRRFCELSARPVPIFPARGTDAGGYGFRRESIIGRPGERMHLQRIQGMRGGEVRFDADYWRSIAQRAWLGAAGEPGALTLHAVAAPAAHEDFARHCAAEQLVQTYETQKGLRYEWSRRPGTSWDWGDALTGCFVAAAFLGLRTDEPLLPASPRPAPPPRHSTRIALVGI